MEKCIKDCTYCVDLAQNGSCENLVKVEEPDQDALWDEVINAFFSLDPGKIEHLNYFREKYIITRK